MGLRFADGMISFKYFLHPLLLVNYQKVDVPFGLTRLKKLVKANIVKLSSIYCIFKGKL